MSMIMSYLRVLGSDGATFQPGGLFYIAMKMALETGNARLDPSDRIDVQAKLPDICLAAHEAVEDGETIYPFADGTFYIIFLRHIEEEDERFDKRSGAQVASMRAFISSLDTNQDWIMLGGESAVV